MAFDFPASPTVGQVFAPPGGPIYTWNGYGWAAQISGGGMPAAPLDALAYNGMQVNGAGQVDQTALGNVFASGYFTDNWYMYYTGSVATLASPIFDDPGSPPGFRSYVRIYTTTPSTTPASDSAVIQTYIEGYRIGRLAFGKAAAMPFTLGFWVAASIPGLYSVSFRNGAQDRAYRTSYTVNTGAVWEYKTLTIPGDVAGTWNATNGLGLMVMFPIVAGSVGPAGVWGTDTTLAVPGAINGAATGGCQLAITGLVVLPGIQAPTAAQAPLIMRPYDQELLLAQRYWWCSNLIAPKGGAGGGLAGMAFTTVNIGGSFRATVPMRVAPTGTLWQNGVQNQVRSSGTGGVIPVSSPAINVTSNQGFVFVSAGSGAPFTVNSLYDFDVQLDARL